MNWKDIKPGKTVYHGLLTHFGKGEVLEIVPCTLLEVFFERGSKRVLVQFEGCDEPVRMQPATLRKTPNKKKIREMLEFYEKRGTPAKDGGDRLILPGKET